MKTEIFLDRVVQHVRFRPDRGAVRRELAGHLDDSAAALQQAEGMDAETAYAQAVENMGDPDEIGRALDRAHSPLLGWTWLVSKVLCIAVCIFLGAPLVLGNVVSLGISAYNLAEYSRANVEFEAPVDTWIDVGETLKLGPHRVAIDWVARLENGSVCVKYHTYRVGRAAWQIGTPHVLVDGERPDGGRSNASYGGTITVGWTQLKGIDAGAHMLTIGWPNWTDTERATIQVMLPAQKEGTV